MSIDIDSFLEIVSLEIRDKDVPVVDLIAVQTKDPFKVLVATILSARTKDEATATASKKLFKIAPDRKALALLPEEQIAKLIYPVGFYKNKARYLKKLPSALENFGGKIPETIEELITLPGVGRKTANLVMSVAFQKPAICVDTHVHRIMNIWKYVTTDTPLKTEMALRDKLPAKHWLSVNSILVAFGQSICRPISPHCDICPLENRCAQKGVRPRKIGGKNMSQPDGLKFISWNVNGIRAVEKKGFIEMLQDFDADVIGLHPAGGDGRRHRGQRGHHGRYCSAPDAPKEIRQVYCLRRHPGRGHVGDSNPAQCHADCLWIGGQQFHRPTLRRGHHARNHAVGNVYRICNAKMLYKSQAGATGSERRKIAPAPEVKTFGADYCARHSYLPGSGHHLHRNCGAH